VYKLQTISVALQKRSYPIWIENGLLTKLPELLKPMNHGQKWVVFSQDGIFRLYGNEFLDDLKAAGYNVNTILLPDGEKAKSLSVLDDVYSQLIEMGCDRSSTFLALGGGVVGDAAGFIAATFMRGVDYIQIPTTLLAMVDSSIGGKTGVNLPAGKNLVGAIWQPKAVVIDPKLLESLPEREISSAMGEVIKYGAILDRDLFDLLFSNLKDLLKLNGMLASQGQYRLLCDADLSVPIEQVDRLLPPRFDGLDVAMGSREVSGSWRIGEPFRRRSDGESS